MHLRDLWIKICITPGILSILMKPIAASPVPWCNRHFSAYKVFSPLARQCQSALGKNPSCDNFHSRDSVLCLIFQTTRKFLLPSSHKPNIKNKFIFTLLVSVFQSVFWRDSSHSFLLKLLGCPGTLMQSGFRASEPLWCTTLQAERPKQGQACSSKAC